MTIRPKQVTYDVLVWSERWKSHVSPASGTLRPREPFVRRLNPYWRMRTSS